MNAHLHYLLAQQRIADLRAAEHARLATDAGTRRRDTRPSTPIVRALPMPTAHPSPEAWPAVCLPGGMSLAPVRRRVLAHQYRPHALDACPHEGCRAALSQTQHSELFWHAYLRYPPDRQRVAREILADVS